MHTIKKLSLVFMGLLAVLLSAITIDVELISSSHSR